MYIYQGKNILQYKNNHWNKKLNSFENFVTGSFVILFSCNNSVHNDYFCIRRFLRQMARGLKSNQHIFILLDSIDQLTPADDAYSLNWLPTVSFCRLLITRKSIITLLINRQQC